MANEHQKVQVEPEVITADEAEDKTSGNTGPSRWRRFKIWYIARKKWAIPATIAVLLLVLAAVPFTRYNLAGLAVKRDFRIKVLDAATNTPVSGARVTLGQSSAETDGSGVALLRHTKTGYHKLALSKKYYKDEPANLLTPILKQKNIPVVKMTATGRQVKITITNLISKKPLQNVNVKAAGTSAKTDSSGSTLMVLPAGVKEQKATLKRDGYNDAEATIKVSGDKIQENQFSLTPAGKIYFLSKLSGKVDVVKTNLDGTARQTVLAGTGKEDDRNTVLLASRDWKYLALLSKRAGGANPSLYLINTSNDSLSIIDEGNAALNLVGWVDDSFVYTLTRNNVQQWQPNSQAIKSFNAVTKKITILDQTNASGTGIYDYISEQIGDVYGYDGQVYYSKNWVTYGKSDQVSTKQATFNSIKTDGSAKKTIKSFAPNPAALSGYIYVSLGLNLKVENPNKLHAEFYDSTGQKFYVYSDGQFKADTRPNASDFFFADYPTFLQSPSGDNTFWAEPRDGKNTLFIGNEDGQDSRQIATLSDYNTYGWFSDNYLLVSKNNSELYIMDEDGKQAPVKISDYHKPAATFQGYGGGYGGL